jgi:hypothetical protein
LFGSFTATLTKRIRALRSARDRGELQVIASSATVDNDLELFRKVSGARSIKHVDEDPRDLSPDSSNTLPPELIAEELTEEDLIAFARNERVPAPLSRVAFDVDATKHDNERLRELLQDALFDYLTASSEDPIVNVVQRLHQELYADPRPHR